MQKQIITLVALTLFSYFSFAQRKILNPAYEFRNTGVSEISRIEIKKNETRLWVHCTFLPGWWMKFENQTFIKASNGEKLFIRSMENGEMDKEIYMPASGDSTFILVFPPLPRGSQAIDYGEGEKTLIYGISLNQKRKAIPQPDTVPASVEEWLNAELEKSKKKTPVDYSSPEFFSRDTVRLVGYIRGYDPRAGFSTGIVYASNDLTDEDFPTVVSIHEDGRFEANIPISHPKYTYLVMADRTIPFYLEPGRSLSMVLNWEEFLTADRLRNQRNTFKDIVFGGPLARVNGDLMSAALLPPDYDSFKKLVKTLAPADFKFRQMQYWKEAEEKLKRSLKEKKLSPQAEKILSNEVMISNASYMFDYLMDRKYQATVDTGNAILKIRENLDYYDFMKLIPLDDPTLLATSSFGTFINRFEFANPFDGSFRISVITSPDKSFGQYLFTELGLKPTVQDKNFLKLEQEVLKKLGTNLTKEETDKMMKDFEVQSKLFYERYKQHNEGYKTKYLKKPENTSVILAKKGWAYKDSVLNTDFRLQPGLVYQIAKVRSLEFTFEQVKDKDAARAYLTAFEDGITHPFLLSEAERMFYQAYPPVAKTAYDLPQGKAADVFRKIIEPHKGKTLIVDFWGIFCGPCIASIRHFKESRHKYKNNGSFDFIFITAENESPLNKYDEFVKEQDLANTYRLSSDDYLYLRELFKFNGIPKYILVGKDGNILNDDFEMHNFESEVEKFIAQKSN